MRKKKYIKTWIEEVNLIKEGVFHGKLEYNMLNTKQLIPMFIYKINGFQRFFNHSSICLLKDFRPRRLKKNFEIPGSKNY